MKEYYANIEKERIIHGETRADVAKLLDMSNDYLSKKIRGIRFWTIEDIETLCKHYDKDYYYLFEKTIIPQEGV